MPAYVIVILLIIGSSIFHHSNKEENQSYPSYKSEYRSKSSRHRTISSEDALDQYWDEIKEHINGTETIDAYSQKSGGNYTLDADISNGEVEAIHFPNGGYIYINADLDSDGTGEGYGSDGYWEVEIDSSLIEEATEEWASENGYTLSY
jgi:hypothetical protein